MRERGKRQGGLSKKTVIILVVIAIILASFAVVYHYLDLGKKISTADLGNEELTDSSGGKVGIIILPPEIEDKGAG